VRQIFRRAGRFNLKGDIKRHRFWDFDHGIVKISGIHDMVM